MPLHAGVSTYVLGKERTALWDVSIKQRGPGFQYQLEEPHRPTLSQAENPLQDPPRAPYPGSQSTAGPQYSPGGGVGP